MKSAARAEMPEGEELDAAVTASRSEPLSVPKLVIQPLAPAKNIREDSLIPLELAPHPTR
jgi:hypothetical protein